MKCLLITSVFPPQVGGSGRWFWEIYRRLPKDQVLIAGGSWLRDSDFDCSHGLNVVRLPLNMSSWSVLNLRNLLCYTRNYRRLCRLVRDHQIDQIHCGQVLPTGLLGCLLRRRFGIPYCCYVHGEEMTYMRRSRELTWLMHHVLNSAQMVIANCQNTNNILVHDHRLQPDKIRILHPGVDVHRFVPAARDAQVRKSLGWHDRKVVLTVGRLQARKGQDRLILALRRVMQQFPDQLYVIVGDGEERVNLKRLVRENRLEGHVQFRHNSSDEELVQCYQQCDLFVLPNRNVDGDFEGFGMVLLEAQACGRPVVAGRSGGTAETMQVPTTGRIVCCDRPEPVAELLIELLGDGNQLESMGRAARKWVEEKFDWDSLARQASALFHGLSDCSAHSNYPLRQPASQGQCPDHDLQPETAKV